MESIVSIISVCVTLLLGIGGLIFNSYVQRKTHSISVITKTRLARREKTKDLLAKMIKFSDTKYLDCLDEKEKKDVISSLAEVSSMIRAEYTGTYHCDIELIDLTEQLKDKVISYLRGTTSQEELMKARNELIKTFDIYIQTEWQRIKLETVGKMKKNSKPTWDEINHSFHEKYDSLSGKKQK